MTRPATRSPLPWLPLLRDTSFRRFLTGQTVSVLGDQVSLLAIPLVGVLVLHANAAQMGYLTAAGLAPSLLFSLAAGARIDRRGHRRATMLVADLGRAALLGTIPLASAAGGLTLTQLYVVAFAGGTLDVLFYVSYSTSFVSIIPKDQFLQGSSLLNGSRSLMTVVGQSAAGLLIAVASAPASPAPTAPSTTGYDHWARSPAAHWAAPSAFTPLCGSPPSVV